MNARTVVSADRLIGAVWGLTPPSTARAQVHAAITAIRRVLRQADSRHVLATRAAGYVITPEPGQLDLDEFTSKLAAAQEEADSGSTQDAAHNLRAALELWSGEPLADVSADFVPTARARLEDRRLSAFERLVDLELSLGRHEVLVDELASQMAAYPLRERLCRQYMLALHRAGRQADALSAGRAFRGRLVEEQGLDPSQGFGTLEQGILRDDPSLQLRPASAGSDPDHDDSRTETAARRANFLPYDTPDFAGRSVELDRLAQLAAEDGRSVTIATIDGMAGIGKTTLAIHAAHELADQFPDAQLFVDLHAYTAGQEPIESGAALEILLRQLGVPGDRIPGSVTDRAAQWRAELSDRRVLAVLDNAVDADQVRPLLPGASGSLIIITSRRRLTDLDGAQPMSLYLPPAEDATTLFTRIVGERGIAEADAVTDVLQLCGFLPLAVRIAAARLSHRPQWTVEYLANRLRDQRRRLTELSTSDRGVATAFALSYQQLDPAQQRMFWLLGLHPGRDIDTHAAAALVDLPLDTAEALLEGLLDAHVLLQHEPARYTFHDLLREHALTTAAAEETVDARHEALVRLFDLYLGTAARAIDVLYPHSKEHRPQIPEPKAPEVNFSDLVQATAWLDAERANLLAAGSYTADHAGERSTTHNSARQLTPWPIYASHLAIILSYYLYDNDHHTDALILHSQALRASRHRGDKVAEARTLTDLSFVYLRRGRYDLATEHSHQAIDLARESGNEQGAARALGCLGSVCWRQRDYDQAHDHYRHSLDLYRKVGDQWGEAFVLNNLGLVYERQGNHEQACGHLRHALDLYGQLGYGSGKAEALNGLGEAARAMGELCQAVEDHRAALALASEVGSRPEQARAQDGLARAHRDLGHIDLARDHATRALDLYRDLGVPQADEVHRFLTDLDRSAPSASDPGQRLP